MWKWFCKYYLFFCLNVISESDRCLEFITVDEEEVNDCPRMQPLILGC